MQEATIASLMKEVLDHYSKCDFILDKEVYRRKVYTYQQIYEKALAICSFFHEQKIKKGDKILIYLINSSDYVSLLWACALSGVIAVPIDFNNSQEFARKIYNKVKAKLVFSSVFRKVEKCKNFYQEEMKSLYENHNNSKFSKVKLPIIKPSDIFEIVFTSGTTSEPKGVVLSNENLYSDVISMRKIITFNMKYQAMLSILPLSHLLEQNLGFFSPIEHGVKIIYQISRKPSAIIETIRKEKVMVITTVPLFLQTLKEKIEFEAKKSNKLEILRKNLKKYSKSSRFIKKFIFNSIHKQLPNLQYFVCGGAALPIEVEEFWTSLGFTILQGYGLTEASPVITCNSPSEKKPGTVGKPLENVEIKIENNEILTKGKNLFQGYYEEPEKTKEVLKNDWLYTGDLGIFDEQGFLTIIGRKKNILVSSSGINIYPEDIEKILNKEENIRESVVFLSEDSKNLLAVVLSDKKLGEKDLDSILNSVNSKLEPHQLLSKIIQWPNPEFPKTSTLKVKRQDVQSFLESSKAQNPNKEKKQESSDKLIKILVEVCEKPENKIKESSSLVSLGLDSIKRIELTVKIEEIFNLEFDESLINEKTRVSDLRKFLKLSQTSKKRKTDSGINSLNSNFFHFLRIPLQFLAVLLSKLIFRMEIKGKENLKIIKEQKTPVIFIANHISMLDTFAVYRALPFSVRLNTFAAAAKDFFFNNFITAFFGRLTFNAFAFSRKENIKQSLADFAEVINRNHNVLIYPEGTRSRTGKLLEFKTGTGLMALNVEVPIIPIKIEGLYDIMPVGRTIPKFNKKVKMTIGKSIIITRMQSSQEITNILHKSIKELSFPEKSK